MLFIRERVFESHRCRFLFFASFFSIFGEKKSAIFFTAYLLGYYVPVSTSQSIPRYTDEVVRAADEHRDITYM